MALKDQTPVAQEKFIEVLKKEGVPYTVQTGFIRVEGPKGRRLYIANTQSVRRVDISGFKVEQGAHEPAAKNGRVMQQLDFNLPEEQVLANFTRTVKHMMSLPPSETARDLPVRGARGVPLQPPHDQAARPSAPTAAMRKAAEIPVLGDGDGHRTKKRKRGAARTHPVPRPSA